MIKKISFTLSLVLIIIVFLVLKFFNNNKPIDPVPQVLDQQFGQQYKATREVVNGKLVTFANSTSGDCETRAKDNHVNFPLIIVQNLKSLKIEYYYEIKFKYQNIPFENANRTFMYKFEVIPINNIQPSILIRYAAGNCGDSDFVGLIILDPAFKPKPGLPEELANDFSITVKDKITNQEFNYPTTGTQEFIDIKYLFDDGKAYLLYATPFGARECMVCDGKYKLQVFEFINNEVKLSQKWNKGQPYFTKNKYSHTRRYGDPDMDDKLLNIFYLTEK